MAQYKVPQDVEADDKLVGPFSFRQFLYLLAAAGLVALAVGLFQIFPLLAIIPVPPILLLLVLALPIKKDQPMETYLVALVSYYLKPRVRLWTPGQKETTILITAPKVVEDNRVRSITGEEANNRLSFLTEIVDSGGYAIKGSNQSSFQDTLIAEAEGANDIFDNYKAERIGVAAERGRRNVHDYAVEGMQNTINRINDINSKGATIQKYNDTKTVDDKTSVYDFTKVDDSVIVKPIPRAELEKEIATKTNNSLSEDNATEMMPDLNASEEEKSVQSSEITAKQREQIARLIDDNPDYDVSTLATQAGRIFRGTDKAGEKGEVFISLH
ncbi:MAG: PrgI family protein [Candidatus Saccharibacteria bacterium]|nr:PrgI family protein [Candidatus Saccharibacteria bacterium]